MWTEVTLEELCKVIIFARFRNKYPKRYIYNGASSFPLKTTVFSTLLFKELFPQVILESKKDYV